MKIAILTRPADRSPKVLALSLQQMLRRLQVESRIYFDSRMLIRLLPLGVTPRFHNPFWKRLYARVKFWRYDKTIIKELRQYDAIIFSECIPNVFWKNYYAIEKLRTLTGRPVLIYDVYYLGNAPTQIEKLVENNDPCIERFDWHLAVSEVTEVRSSPEPPWSRIGLDLSLSGLQPDSKKEFLALVDFERSGYESIRKQQIEVLEELGVTYVSLEGDYTIEEIRQLYKQACVLLLQFPEAFGVPIAECLACGAYVATPNSAWAMSWRLDEHPEVHKEGMLPELFLVYRSKDELRDKIRELKQNYKLEQTPQEVFSKFIQYYPYNFYGDLTALRDVIQRIQQHAFN